MNDLTQLEVQRLFSYDDSTGLLTRIITTSSRGKTGNVIKSRNTGGHVQVRIKGKKYLAHRVIWLYWYGVWPKEHIDHINGIRHDNRIENLREATRSENGFNRISYSGSKSKYKGVSKHGSGKWCAYYQYNGQPYWLGLWKTEELAAQAYKRATEQIHGNFANYNLERYEDEE